MRPKVIIATVVALCLVSTLIWLLRPSRSHGPSTPGHDADLQQTNVRGTALDRDSPSATSPHQTNALWQTNRDALSTLHPGFEAWKQSIHRPIEFYGKVVDENDRPVQGAKVLFHCNQHVHPEGTLSTNSTTDQNGLFSLSGVMGSTLGVEVRKEGYYPVRRANETHFDYRASFREPFRPDPNNPVLFHLLKRGTGVELITSQHGISPILQISGLTNGTPLRVDLFQRKAGSEGQIELSAVKPTPSKTPTDWSFRMSVPDGGFVEHNDEFPFEAPEAGYTSTVDFHFQAGTTNWTRDFHKRSYIKFGQPPKYGRLEIETGIDRAVILSYAINPDGSRYLEPKEPVPERRELPPGITEVIPGHVKPQE